MVTHEPDIGNHCKRIVHIKDGLCVEDEVVQTPLKASDVLENLKQEREREQRRKSALGVQVIGR